MILQPAMSNGCGLLMYTIILILGYVILCRAELMDHDSGIPKTLLVFVFIAFPRAEALLAQLSA